MVGNSCCSCCCLLSHLLRCRSHIAPENILDQSHAVVVVFSSATYIGVDRAVVLVQTVVSVVVHIVVVVVIVVAIPAQQCH